MQVEDLNNYLLPRDDPGDAVFKGTEQETLSATQERQLRQLVRQVRAQCKAGEANDLLRLFDTTNPEAIIFRNALAKDINDHPEMYKKDIKEGEEDKENKGPGSWGDGLKKFGKGALWYVAPTALIAGAPYLWSGAKWAANGIKGLFTGGKHKNKKHTKRIKKRKKYYYH